MFFHLHLSVLGAVAAYTGLLYLYMLKKRAVAATSIRLYLVCPIRCFGSKFHGSPRNIIHLAWLQDLCTAVFNPRSLIDGAHGLRIPELSMFQLGREPLFPDVRSGNLAPLMMHDVF